MFGFNDGSGSGRGGRGGRGSSRSNSRSSSSRSTPLRSRSNSSRRMSNVRNLADYMDDGREQGTRRVRSSTGRNPGTVIDPMHDGRLHHGDEMIGVRGQPLLSEQEWIESHHVAHPGAIGNQNAAGPHNIPADSLERIREGGRKGGEAHRGMRFERIDGEAPSRSRSRNSRSNSSMSSRASGGTRSRSRSRSNQQYKQQQEYQGRGRDVIDINEIRDMRDRLDEVLEQIG